MKPGVAQLPENMQDEDLSQAEPRTYEISDSPLSSKLMTVLILEDDAVFASTLKETLEIQDYRVTVVPSGREGIEQVLVTHFDAIVCDMVMPNFPGDMFYRAVERTRPHLCKRFIFITGHQNDPRIVQFVTESGCLVLWKPFEMRRLFDALETVTGRSS